MTEFFRQWYGILLLVLVDAVVFFAIVAFTYRWFFKRVLDFLCASVCIILLSPLFIAVALRSVSAKKRGDIDTLYRRDEHVCKRGKVRELLTFAQGEKDNSYGAWLKRTGFYKLPMLLDIWLGKLSFIGPRAFTESDCEGLTEVEMDRFLVRAGLIAPYGFVRADSELLADEKYAWGYSLFMDTKIFFTWLLGKIRS